MRLTLRATEQCAWLGATRGSLWQRTPGATTAAAQWGLRRAGNSKEGWEELGRMWFIWLRALLPAGEGGKSGWLLSQIRGPPAGGVGMGMRQGC